MESHGKVCIIDIETDGLDASVIHCVGAKPCGEGVREFLSRDEFKRFISQFDFVVAHNGVSFDFPMLRKLWGVSIPFDKQVDTLILSRMSKPDREKGHSLQSWGEKLGHKKMEYDGPWDVCTVEMIEYCKQDVLVCELVYKTLLEEMKKFTTVSVRDEHRMQQLADHVQGNGFYFDLGKAHKFLYKLLGEQEEIKLQMQDVFPPTVVELKTKTKEIPFNPASRKQIGERLMEKGWKPKAKTPTGKPQVDEAILEKLDIPEAQVLARYFMLQKRTGLLESWIKACGEDRRVRCTYHTLGAITNRMSCSSPNLQQVPSMRKPYGFECRELWHCEDGNKLIDTDANSLELRVLAHYMNDEAFTKEVLEGDIHTENQRRAGLPTRDAAKTFIYALLYGAGDAKLGTVVGGNEADGRRLREAFLSSLPAFRRLREAVNAKGGSEGTLKGLDGRVLHVRHSHASLNTLIQGSSAILMKKWFMNTARTLKARQTGAKVVAMVHDEIVIESPKKSVDSVHECVKLSIAQVNNEYKLRCQLDCDVDIGNNWSEVH